MSLQIKSLKVGEVKDTTPDANLYTAPDTASAIVKAIRFVNKSASPASLTVTFKKWVSGTGEAAVFLSQPMLPIGLSIPPHEMVIVDEELTLSAKDQIVAKVGTDMTANSGIGFIVSGVEREQA